MHTTYHAPRYRNGLHCTTPLLDRGAALFMAVRDMIRTPWGGITVLPCRRSLTEVRREGEDGGVMLVVVMDAEVWRGSGHGAYAMHGTRWIDRDTW